MGWNSPRRGLSSSGGDRFGVARVSITLTAELIRFSSHPVHGARGRASRLHSDVPGPGLYGREVTRTVPSIRCDRSPDPLQSSRLGRALATPGALQRLSRLFRRTVTWQVPSDRVVAGSISCWTDRGEFRSLNEEELHELFQSVGYHANRQAAA